MDQRAGEDADHVASLAPPDSRSRLPWWTWVAPLFIFHLGTQFALHFKIAVGSSTWYLPIELGFVLVQWWGPRVLLGMYLNAVLSAGLWGLPRSWLWPVYSLPETVEVGLSWWLFNYLARGKPWLPDTTSVLQYGLLAVLIPVSIAGPWVQLQLLALGDLPRAEFWPALTVGWVGDMLGSMALSVPALMFLTPWMQRRGWATTARGIATRHHEHLTPQRQAELAAVLAVLLIMTVWVPIQDYWFVYGAVIVYGALRFGVGTVALINTYLVLLTLLLPAVRVWFFGEAWPLQGRYVEVATNLAVLCFVGLMVSHSHADLRREVAASSRTRAMLSGILNSVPQSVFWKDRNSVYLGCNQVFARALGLAHPEDVVGKTDYDFPWPPDQAETYRANDREVMETGVPLLHVVELRSRPDGKQYWVDVSKVALRDARGRIYGVLGIYDDITDRKLAEQQRDDLLVREQDARKQAEVASAAKDQFIAVLSHELRTPLTPVLMTLRLWRESGILGGPHEEDLEMLIRNVQLEARLIDDLLDTTRIARGKLHLHRTTCDVYSLVRETAQMFRGAEGAEIVVDLSPGDAPIDCDPVRIRQVIWNFLSNARKFTPPDGRITVRAGRDRREAWVSVKDTGVGIAPEQIPGLFVEFAQVVAHGARPQGLGLGLAISRAIARAHGGEVGCTSEGHDRGAEFFLRLPLVPAGTIPPPAKPAPATTVATPTHPAPARSILLVEDHPDTARVLTRFLKASGYDVHKAHSLAEARGVLSQWTPDLIVSDLGLPDGSGHELMSELRDAGREIRGIAVSGYGAAEDIQRSEDAGFSLHLTKPVAPAALLDAIGQVLHHGAATAARES